MPRPTNFFLASVEYLSTDRLFKTKMCFSVSESVSLVFIIAGVSAGNLKNKANSENRRPVCFRLGRV